MVIVMAFSFYLRPSPLLYPAGGATIAGSVDFYLDAKGECKLYVQTSILSGRVEGQVATQTCVDLLLKDKIRREIANAEAQKVLFAPITLVQPDGTSEQREKATGDTTITANGSYITGGEMFEWTCSGDGTCKRITSDGNFTWTTSR